MQNLKQNKHAEHLNSKRALVLPSILLSSLTLFFIGCSKKQPDIIPTMNGTLRLGHAKHFDIPQPVGFFVTPKNTAKDGDYFLYTGTLPLNKTIEFYAREMERNGWEIQNFSNKIEGLLWCSKPHKLCTVSIRIDGTNKTIVHIFVKQDTD